MPSFNNEDGSVLCVGSERDYWELRLAASGLKIIWARGMEELLRLLGDLHVSLVLCREDEVSAQQVARIVASAAEVPILILSRVELDRAELLGIGPVWVLPDDTPQEKLLHAVNQIVLRQYNLLADRHTGQAFQRSLQDHEKWGRATKRYLDEILHELKTPVSVVQGFCSNLLDGIEGELAGNQRSSIERIKVAAELMTEILSRGRQLPVLPESTDDSVSSRPSKPVGQREKISIHRLCTEVVTMLQPSAEQKGVQLRLTAEPSVILLWGDKAQLMQLLVNLVSNAIRHTPKGGMVELVTHFEEVSLVGGAKGACRIMVRDTGPGVPEEYLDKIFSSGWSSSSERSGLGLAICREIVEAHSGTLNIDRNGGRTELGKRSAQRPTGAKMALPDRDPMSGALFHLLLPIDARSVSRGFRMLLVEDRVLAGQLLIELKNRHGSLLPTSAPTDMEALADQIVDTASTVVFAGKVDKRLESQTLDIQVEADDLEEI